jgi:hypothetical protein
VVGIELDPATSGHRDRPRQRTNGEQREKEASARSTSRIRFTVSGALYAKRLLAAQASPVNPGVRANRAMRPRIDSGLPMH